MREAYRLTGAQLCVAGQVCGYSHLLLPEDPFRGWLVEEIRDSLRQARRELSQAGVLLSGSGTISDQYRPAIDALGAPERSISVTYTKGGKEVNRLSLHRREGEWFCLDQQTEEEYLISIITQDGLQAVLGDFFQLGDQPPIPGSEITLGAETLRTAREKARTEGEDECRLVLKNSGLTQTHVDLLVPVLVEPVASGSVVTISWENQVAEQRDALAFLDGKDGLYMFIEEKDLLNWIKLTPISANGFLEAVYAAVEMLA